MKIKMKGLIPYGLNRMFGGMRRGRPMWAAFGTAALIAGLATKYRPPKRELLVKKKLKNGKKYEITFVRNDVGA
jgi:hypothetical protein